MDKRQNLARFFKVCCLAIWLIGLLCLTSYAQLQPVQSTPKPVLPSPTPAPGAVPAPHSFESDRQIITKTLDTVTSSTAAITRLTNDLTQLHQKLDGIRTEFTQKLDGLAAQGRLPQNWATQLQPAQRWELALGGQAVLDKETGLVWERAISERMNWGRAASRCRQLKIGNRMGWRLPTVAEALSLYPLSGHPFLQLNSTWTATINANPVPADRSSGQVYMYVVDILGGNAALIRINESSQVLCVRGGQELEQLIQ